VKNAGAKGIGVLVLDKGNTPCKSDKTLFSKGKKEKRTNKRKRRGWMLQIR